MPASEREAPQPQPLSMRDLLASCAAATAVSTPPRDAQDPEAREDGENGEDNREVPVEDRAEQRDAA